MTPLLGMYSWVSAADRWTGLIDMILLYYCFPQDCARERQTWGIINKIILCENFINNNLDYDKNLIRFTSQDSRWILFFRQLQQYHEIKKQKMNILLTYELRSCAGNAGVAGRSDAASLSRQPSPVLLEQTEEDEIYPCHAENKTYYDEIMTTHVHILHTMEINYNYIIISLPRPFSFKINQGHGRLLPNSIR